MAESPAGGLSRIETLWAEMMDLARRLDETARQLKGAESSVGSTVINIEESLEKVVSQMEALSGSAEGVIAAKEQELRQRIEQILAEAADKNAQRDQDVVALISDEVGHLAKEHYETIYAALRESVTTTAAQVRLESVKAIRSASETNQARYVAAAIIAVSILLFMSALGGWFLSNLHYSGSAKKAESVVTSSNGMAALKLAEMNDMEAMLDCDGFKQSVQYGHTFCVPMDANRSVSGWRVK